MIGWPITIKGPWRAGGAGPLRFSVSPTGPAAPLTLSRSSVGTWIDGDGILQEAPADAPRFAFDLDTSGFEGLLVEGSRTNGARYGETPDDSAGWLASAIQSGMSITRIGTGVAQGLAFADYLIAGTATATYVDQSYISGASVMAVAQGQAVTASVWFSVVGGSTSNIGNLVVACVEQTATGQYLGHSNSASALGLTSLERITVTRSMTNPSVGQSRLAIIVSDILIGQPVNITIRIACPQLEIGSTASSFIPTGTVPETRDADVLSVPGLQGAFDIRYLTSAGPVDRSGQTLGSQGVLPNPPSHILGVELTRL